MEQQVSVKMLYERIGSQTILIEVLNQKIAELQKENDELRAKKRATK